MTAEVILMNRHAVAVAADSAATVTRWQRGQERRRYFKGADKIFNISGLNPVGLVVYGTGNLQGVPWDVLAKTYREELGTGGFDRLAGYVDGFFGWVANNSDAYPESFLTKQLLNEIVASGQRVSATPLTECFKEKDKDKRDEVLIQEFDKSRTAVFGDTYIANVTEEFVREISDKIRRDACDSIQNDNILAVVAHVVGLEKVCDAAIEAVFRENFTTLSNTGVVFCGYGNKEYFPSVESFRCYGNILGTLLISREDIKCASISQENTAAIVAFAKTDMIDTFVFGSSFDGIVHIDGENAKSLDLLTDKLVESGHLANDADIDKIKEDAHEGFKEGVKDYFIETHAQRLRRVVGLLPIEDLAELAETLVTIESIKERMTTDDETVGGPVDVAVISKNDGFIWIKRKHYFDAALNPRFFNRQTMNLEDDKR